MGKGVHRRDGVPNVVVAIAQELAEDVYGHDAEAAVSLDLEDGHDRLVENRVPDILGGVGVRGDLGKNIIHGLAGLRVTFAQKAHETQNPDLKERIGNSGDIVFRTIAGRD